MQIDEPATLDEDVLLCPRCGQDYLHSGRIFVYERSEDAPETTLVLVDGGQISANVVPSKNCENPSARRNGIAIEFWCENCESNSQLAIAQHKGQTYVRWRRAGG